MGQIAYSATTGKMIEAFSVGDAEWNDLLSAPRGALLMPRSAWPAVPKTSIRGLRFFAHHPGYTGILPKPESYAHTRLKIDVVKAARALGYKADLEVPGSDPDANEWVADALVTRLDGSRVAFEVQLSSQHLEDFRSRTARYRRSGVACCWIIPRKPVSERLTKALCYANREAFPEHGNFQGDDGDLITFVVDLVGKDDYPNEPLNFRFSRGQQHRRLDMGEAIDGALRGLPTWRIPSWHWGTLNPVP